MPHPAEHDRLTFASRFEEAARVEQRILDAASRHGFDEPSQFGIKLALEEALINAIRHGNKADPEKHVEVEFEVDAEKLVVRVCDEGPGFQPTTVPDPTLDENLEKPNGRGLLLMRAYMSEVTYNDSGNCVTLVKRRDDPPAAAEGD